MRLLLAVLVALLAVPAIAAADDTSLDRTWSSYLAAADRFETMSSDVGENEVKARKQLDRLFRRAGALVRSTSERLKADAATSNLGALARDAALRSLQRADLVFRRYRKAFPLLYKALELEKQGRKREARTAIKRFAKLLRPVMKASKEAERLEATATRLFRKATT